MAAFRRTNSMFGLARRCFHQSPALSQSVKKPQQGLTYATAPLPKYADASADAPVADSPNRDICRASLSSSLDQLPPANYAELPKGVDPYHTEVTVLENGLRVASAQQFGEFCTVGVLADAGCRYEVAYPSGMSHFVEKLAFNSTENFSAREALYAELEQHGGICDCQSTRDTFIFAASCHNSGLHNVLGIIADATWKPKISDADVSLAREIIRFDSEDLHRNPNPEQILTDWAHQAAYKNNTLGLPKFCPPENVDKIHPRLLYSFLKQHFTPQRMVVAGVGTKHSDLVRSARKYFLEESPIWSREMALAGDNLPGADQSTAQYTGGLVAVEKDLSKVAQGPTPMPELAHFVLGLESASYKDPDFVPFCVLHSLMGGGGSFSAGGPGKGMYTRLYLNVLNRYHWMYNATAYHHVYMDTGLFYIHASAPPKQLGDVCSVILSEFLAMTGALEVEELARAKNQLQSMLMMNIEQRPVMFEDVGRQVLGHGYRKSPLDYIEEIKKVSTQDIARVAERLLSSKPAIVGYGNLGKLPSKDRIDAALAQRNVDLLKPSKFFPFGK